MEVQPKVWRELRLQQVERKAAVLGFLLSLVVVAPLAEELEVRCVVRDTFAKRYFVIHLEVLLRELCIALASPGLTNFQLLDLFFGGITPLGHEKQADHPVDQRRHGFAFVLQLQARLLAEDLGELVEPLVHVGDGLDLDASPGTSFVVLVFLFAFQVDTEPIELVHFASEVLVALMLLRRELQGSLDILGVELLRLLGLDRRFKGFQGKRLHVHIIRAVVVVPRKDEASWWRRRSCNRPHS